LERSDEFAEDFRSKVGKDGNLRSILAKKIAKIQENPDRVGVGKTGPLRGLKAERVGHYVILFEVKRNTTGEDGTIVLRRFIHHNDRLYDP
jgi:mRNA-degrading endonuclease RelE of RelBE toxin-antitoxin system